MPELTPLPTEGVFDKLAMSAFEGTWLDMALRDCGINAFIIIGVATEIGIEPTVHHGADPGYIPVLVSDACGAGKEEAAKRSLGNLKFMGDAIVIDTETLHANFATGQKQNTITSNEEHKPHIKRNRLELKQLLEIRNAQLLRGVSDLSSIRLRRKHTIAGASERNHL